jgi:GNAT superfamily N-acetyltransferase
MIKQMNKYDIPKVIEMLWNYHDSGSIPGLEINDETTANKILSMIVAGGGIGLISHNDDELTGMLLALCVPYMWDNSKLVMTEIAYWVEPEYRHTTAGYRLLKEYLKLCDEMKEKNRIHFCTMSQMEGQELNYSRFGLKPIEHTWSY